MQRLQKIPYYQYFSGSLDVTRCYAAYVSPQQIVAVEPREGMVALKLSNGDTYMVPLNIEVVAEWYAGVASSSLQYLRGDYLFQLYEPSR